MPRTDPDLLRGGGSDRNAVLLRATLAAGEADGPDADRVTAIRDAVALNSAAALVAFAAASAAAAGEPVDDRDLVARVADQLPVVRAVLESGAALDVLDGWIAVTRELAAGDLRG